MSDTARPMQSDQTGAPARTDVEAVPDAVAPPPGNPRFPLVDGVRALATLSVVVYHMGLLSHAFGGGGWHRWLAFLTFGPQMFFMFSGFLLYRPFVSSRVRGTPRMSFGNYFRNRALRVIPAYWVFLTIWEIWPGLPGDVFGEPWKYYGMTHIYFPDSVVSGLNVSWTLCTELTFYFVLPFVVIGFDALTRRAGAKRARAIELGVWLVVIALSWTYVHVLRDRPITSQIYGLTLALPGQAAFFAMGMALARLAVPNPGERPLRDRIPVWWVASAGCWAAAFGVYALRMHLDGIGQATLTLLNGVVGFLLLAPAIFAAPRDRGPESVLNWRWLKWLGLVSYGTYLAHYPIVHQLAKHGVGGNSFFGFVYVAAIATALSVGLGALSYYALERPILRFKAGRHGRRKLAVAGPPDVPYVEGKAR